MQESVLSLRMLHEHAFALVAPGQEARLPTGVVVHSVATGPLTDSRDLLPGLIEIDSLNACHVDALCMQVSIQQRDGELPILCALIGVEPGCDATSLRRHLAAVQVRHGPQGAKAWLRAHDPRVWIQLQRAMSEDSLRLLFGPCTCWAVPLGSTWWRFERPTLPTKPHLRHLSESEEWAALGRIGAVNRALAMLGVHDDGVAICETSPQLDEWIQRAQLQHGIQRVDDLAAFAWFAAETHPDFDQHPAGKAVMASQGGDAHIADLLQAIPAEQRINIRSDLTRRRTRT